MAPGQAGILHPAIRVCQQHPGLSLHTCRPPRLSWKRPGKPGSEIGKGCAHFTKRKGEGQGPNLALLILTGCFLGLFSSFHISSLFLNLQERAGGPDWPMMALIPTFESEGPRRRPTAYPEKGA